MADFSTEELLAKAMEQQDNTNLALAATVEALDAHTAVLAKADDEAAELVKAAQAKTAHAALVKEISQSILKELGKVDNGMPGLDRNDPTRGSDYDGDDNAAGKGGASNVDDSETPVSSEKNITDQQATLQASTELFDGGESANQEVLKSKHDDELDADGKMSKADDDKSKKYPNKEDEPDDYKDMKKALAAMQSQLDSRDAEIEKGIKDGTESILKTMGIVKTDNLKTPVMISDSALGLNAGDETVLTKSDDDNYVEEPLFADADMLSKMSYHQLRTIEERLENNDTDGLPVEVIQGFKSRKVN